MNKKTIFIIAGCLVLVIGVYYFGVYKSSDTPLDKDSAEIANPAAVYCEEEGGESINIDFESGTRSFCVFEDDSECDQWGFYRKECDKGDLFKDIIEEGDGPMADEGDTVSVHYVGTLEDGTEFDSSRERGEPFSFTIGAGEVIKGWDQGVIGMRAGETRKLTISPELAYGDRGVGPIPPNATLNFEIEVLEITRGG